jgi:hypothetical protein
MVIDLRQLTFSGQRYLVWPRWTVAVGLLQLESQGYIQALSKYWCVINSQVMGRRARPQPR